MPSNEISFFVQGIPVPKGSAKGFVNKWTKRVIIMQTNRERLVPWASTISHEASKVWTRPPSSNAFTVSVDFFFNRPKSHFGTGKKSGVLRADAPQWHISTPDTDKLLRSVLDALTAIVYVDDRQVFGCPPFKYYVWGPWESEPLTEQDSDRSGVRITIREYFKNV